MTERIDRYITCREDLDNYLRTTGKFGKRFYCWTIRYDIDDTHWLKIESIAISRDLVYKIVWEMEIYQLEDDMPSLLPKDLPEGYKQGSMPDTIPKSSEWCDLLYPYKVYNNYADVFRYNRFIEVDRIYEK